jgi:polysaccharide biosynthesis/export protein
MKLVICCKRLFLVGALVTVTSLVFGQSAAPATAQTAPVRTADPAPAKTATPSLSGDVAGAANADAGETLIGAGDLLKIGVIGATDYDQEVRVASNGNAALALIGNVHLAGLSVDQASQLIRKRLLDAKYFSDPQVTVFEKEYATQGVSVLGEVQKPGVYPLIGPHRLFDVLSQAGGTTAKAGELVTVTRQTEPRSPQNVRLSSNPDKNNESNIEMHPGDTVVVSKAGVVYVVGDVRKPSGFVMESHGMSVLQALALAEGPNPTAALKSAKIIRATPAGPTEIPIELKKILAAKAPDLRLQAEDIIFVPSSTAKNVAGRTLQSIVNVATGVAIYRVP